MNENLFNPLALMQDGVTSFVTTRGENVNWGNNGDYSLSDFLDLFSEFTGIVDSKYSSLFNVFATLASNSLSEKKFGTEVWRYVMGLHIAHNLKSRLMSIIPVEQEVSSEEKAQMLISNITNVVTSDNAADVSVNYDVSITALDNNGEWNRTEYGQQLMTILDNYSLDVWLV